MSRNPVKPISRDQFLELSERSGLPILAADLFQLNRRKLLCPLNDSPVGQEQYCSVHLYLLAIYFEAVRSVRHPWSVSAPERTLDEVGRICRELSAVIDTLMGSPKGSVDAATVASVAMDMERFIHGIDPFGPLTQFIDLMRPDVIEQLRGAGRLYAELRLTAEGLAELAEALDAGDVDDTPHTEPLDLAVMMGPADDEAAEPVEDLRRTQVIATDDEANAAEDMRETQILARTTPVSTPLIDRSTPVSSPPVTPEATKLQIRAASDDEPVVVEAPTQRIVLDAAEAADEPDDVAVEAVQEAAPEDSKETDQPVAPKTSSVDEAWGEVTLNDGLEVPPESRGNGGEFGREQVTSRTKDLAQRLESLRKGDQKVVQERSAGLSPKESFAPENAAEKIAKLNRLREEYLRDQKWDALVELYEDGLDLFVEPAERQQVLLVLAILYETKLGKKGQAFATFCKAHDERGPAAAVAKALDGVERLGKISKLREKYVTWLEEQLEGDWSEREHERRAFQRRYAFALHGAGHHHRAFLFLASMLAEAPNVQIDVQALDDLEKLARDVDGEEIEGFFADILEQDVKPRVRGWVAQRAARHYVDTNDNEKAVQHFKVALSCEPENELAFLSLVGLLEELEDWAELVEVYEHQVEVGSPERKAKLAEGLAQARQRLNENPDAAIAGLEKRLESNCDDIAAIDALIVLYDSSQRFAEAYAYLSRLIPRSKSADIQIKVLRHMAEIAVRHLHAPEEAALHYERALEVGGPRRELFEGLATTRLENGDWTDAVTVIRALTEAKSFEMSSSDEVQWLLRGASAAKKAGREPERIQFLERVLEIEPGHAEASSAL